MVEIEPNTKLLFTGEDGLHLDFKKAKLEFPDPEGLGEFINDITAWTIHGVATDPPTLQIEGKGDVFCMGIPVRNVDFYREQSIEMAKFGMMRLVLMILGPSIFRQLVSSSLPKAAPTSNSSDGRSLRRRSTEDEEFIVNGVHGFSSALSGSLVDLGMSTIDSASIKVDSTGVNLKTEGRLNGHQPLQIKLGQVGFDVTVNGGQIATITIRGIDIIKGSPDFGVDLNIAPMLDPRDSAIISKAAVKLASGDLTGLFTDCRRLYVNGPANETILWISELVDSIDVSHRHVSNSVDQDTTLLSPGSIYDILWWRSTVYLTFSIIEFVGCQRIKSRYADKQHYLDPAYSIYTLYYRRRNERVALYRNTLWREWTFSYQHFYG